ncbi:hypothetical protein [Patulibacter minatonensis]|uniref:hypothetical protein n=1 Tax=Patulibacter minatonensis TaxID=298163 RepID=UPI00047E2B0D|nr:hypothetical protein [Patulibacter minatonensis]
MSPARPTRSRPARAVVAVLAVPASALPLLPATAGAAISTTNVTTPADGAVLEGPFSGGGGPVVGGPTLSGPVPGPLVVRGVAPGAVDGDEVVLVCEQRVEGATVLTPMRFAPPAPGEDPVAVITTVEDGAFTAEVDAPDQPCRVRALPEELAPTGAAAEYRPATLDLAAYAGPRVLGGSSSRAPDASGPGGAPVGVYRRVQSRGTGDGTTLGFGVRTGPLGLGLQAASGGLLRTAVVDDTTTRLVFGPSGAAGGIGLRTDADGHQERYFGLLVDDRPASVAPRTSDGTVGTAERTVDPATGAQTVVETSPVGILSLGSGTADEPSGVVLERTFRQERDGRVFRFSDVWRSTDGRPHRLEVRYSASAPVDRAFEALMVAPPTFRVPWDTGDAFVPGTVDRPIAPAPAGRATIWMTAPRFDSSPLVPTPDPPAPREGAADEPAQGAVSFDAPPVDGVFLGPYAFLLRFQRSIPAGGATSIEHTYVQDTTREGVEGLVRGLDPPAPDPGPDTAPDPAPGPSRVPDAVAPAGTGPAAPAASAVPAAVDPLPRLSSAVRIRLADRSQGSRLRALRPITVALGGAVAGRYGVTLRRDVGRGRGLRTIASGVRTIARDGTLRLTVRPTRFGRAYLDGLRRADRRSVRLRVIVTWTAPGKERRRRELVRTVTLR